MQATGSTFDIYLIDQAINCDSPRMLALSAVKHTNLKHPNIQTPSINVGVSSHPNRVPPWHSAAGIQSMRIAKEITKTILTKSYEVLREHALSAEDGALKPE